MARQLRNPSSWIPSGHDSFIRIRNTKVRKNIMPATLDSKTPSLDRKVREFIRVFYYHDALPYFIDSGAGLQPGDSVTIHGVPFTVFRIREIPANDELRIWID